MGPALHFPFFGNQSQNLNFFKCVGSSRLTNGAGDVQVVELSLAVKIVLVTWKNIKINLNEVAVLRFIKKLTVPEICNALH